MTTFWYRYVDWATAAPLDDGDMPTRRSGVHVHCEQYTVIKETPCGVWLTLYRLDVGKLVFSELDGNKRWVSKTSRKRFACPTKELALESFRARKRKQASIYRARAKYADEALAFAEREFGKLAVDELNELVNA